VLAAWGRDRRRGAPHFGRALRAAREHRAGARAALVRLAADPDRPAIVRATATAELAEVGVGHGARDLLVRLLRDAEPMVRRAALVAVESLGAADRLALAAPLLRDPVRSVRFEAERALRGLPPDLGDGSGQTDLAAVRAERGALLARDLDRGEAWLERGALHLAQGEIDSARSALEQALEREPAFPAALLNLADLHRATGRDRLGEPLLRRAVALAPGDPRPRYALGLWLARAGRAREATEALAEAARRAPHEPRYAFAHGLALASEGRGAEARRVLEAGHARFPEDRDLLLALATRARDRGDLDEARRHARALLDLDPADADARRLLAELEAGVR
jgi:tetratricopeptide (TPR) repeat protein